jgi:hypothetical protein
VLPDVPTANEASIAGYEATIWLRTDGCRNAEACYRQDQCRRECRGEAADIVKLWTGQGAVPMSMTPKSSTNSCAAIL